MGIDLDLAVGQVDEEFVCSICKDILENPVEIKGCVHLFCDECIRGALQFYRTYPLHRSPVEESDLGQPRRYFLNMLAKLKVRCPVCSDETTHGDFDRHVKNCPQNSDAAIGNVEYTVKDEELSCENSCVPYLCFLEQKIATLELEKETENKHFEKEIERLVKGVSGSRKSPYILTWNAKFPTPQNHQMNIDDFYCTWNNYVGNLVDGTKKRNVLRTSFKLDHGEMDVGLYLDKETDERNIHIQFWLTSGKKGRVKLNYSLSSAGKVLWQKERTEELEDESDDETGLTGVDIADVLPSDLPSKLLVTVEVIEWEPNTNFEDEKKHLESEIERLSKSASESRKSPYILTWNAKFPTPQNHQTTCDDFYYTWNTCVGNLVDGTKKRNPRFKLDHGEMTVGLCLKKGTDRRSIQFNFHLTTGKKARVRFNYSLSSAGNVLWQKERTEELKVESNDEDGWTGGHIYDVLPSDLPSNPLVTVEVIEWEPNKK